MFTESKQKPSFVHFAVISGDAARLLEAGVGPVSPPGPGIGGVWDRGFPLAQTAHDNLWDLASLRSTCCGAVTEGRSIYVKFHPANASKCPVAPAQQDGPRAAVNPTPERTTS